MDAERHGVHYAEIATAVAGQGEVGGTDPEKTVFNAISRGGDLLEEREPDRFTWKPKRESGGEARGPRYWATSVTT